MEGYCSLGSGSKGNMTLLRGSQGVYLIDVGFSLRKTEQLLEAVGVTLADVRAILITHEHHDHICGIEAIVQQYEIPIYANSLTARAIHDKCKKRPKFRIFENGTEFLLDDVAVYPFSIPHDTVDPVAYTFSWKKKKLGLCTDIGFPTPIAAKALQGCTHLILEANHDPSMVHACNRPDVYKKRVLSMQGHLSNEQARKLLESVVHEGLEHVSLAHLSQECNHPEQALKVMEGLTVPMFALSQDGPNPFMSFIHAHAPVQDSLF